MLGESFGSDEPIVAGPYVRLACKRHLDDRSKDRWSFNASAADHVIQFFETVLRLPDTIDAVGMPRLFHLEPFQAFIIGSLFGWQDKGGTRRFRDAYIEMGKGNGKTPLCAGIGLYGLVMDGELAPEIYAAAVTRDQAMTMFRDAVRMVQCSPELNRILKISGGEDHPNNIAYRDNLGFFRPFSRDQGLRSGQRPSMALIDEVHEHPSGEAINKIRAGFKHRPNPLSVEITNSGFDLSSICWQHHEHSRKVAERIVEDDQWFSYVCSLDEGDEPLKDTACHIKSNPGLGIIIKQPYLDAQVKNATNIQAETNSVLRLNFCVWTQAEAGCFDMAKWMACQPMPSDDDLIGEPCYAGLDLGETDDFCAFLLVWPLDDGRYVVKPRFWIPEAALLARPDRPYEQWQRSGLLAVTQGDYADFDLIEEAVIDACRANGVRELAYDKRFAAQMALHIEAAGVTCTDTPQGWNLNEPLRKIMAWAADGVLCHGNHEILTWMASNATVRYGRNNEIRLDKQKSKDKIDGVSALAMAADRIVRRPVAAEWDGVVVTA